MWILVIGLAAAAVVLAAGAMNTHRLQDRAEWASICDLPPPPKNHADIDVLDSWLQAGNVSTGDPDADAVLAKSGIKTHDAVGAGLAARAAGLTVRNPVEECYAKYGHVPDAEAALRASKSWPPVVAAVIAVLSALPWLWYFLLRRIAELRAAIGGKPPSG